MRNSTQSKLGLSPTLGTCKGRTADRETYRMAQKGKYMYNKGIPCEKLEPEGKAMEFDALIIHKMYQMMSLFCEENVVLFFDVKDNNPDYSGRCDTDILFGNFVPHFEFFIYEKCDANVLTMFEAVEILDAFKTYAIQWEKERVK